MGGRRVSGAWALGVAVAAGIGAAAAVAEGARALEGSPAAVGVAQRVLAHSRHVVAMEWRQTGDQWECPSSDGPIVSPAVTPPARNCRRATIAFDENLRHGVIVQSLATATARGLATETSLVTDDGTWTRSGRARCWDADGTGSVTLPAFSYAGEKLSIVGRTPTVISLRGVAPRYRETDTIDAQTFAVSEIDERVTGFGGTADLVASFAEMERPFALPPKPRRVCPEIVRFPPHRG
jgi:hypothetical protein